MSFTVFTAWGYEVSALELIAAITSITGVWLGTTGKRITWPWWALSSALYMVFFYQADLFASAALQIVFIIAAIWGWRGRTRGWRGRGSCGRRGRVGTRSRTVPGFCGGAARTA